MNKAAILAVVLIILCGGIAYGQEDPIPKNIESDSSLLPEAKADTVDDGYYLRREYPNPF